MQPHPTVLSPLGASPAARWVVAQGGTAGSTEAGHGAVQSTSCRTARGRTRAVEVLVELVQWCSDHRQYGWESGLVHMMES